MGGPRLPVFTSLGVCVCVQCTLYVCGMVLFVHRNSVINTTALAGDVWTLWAWRYDKSYT